MLKKLLFKIKKYFVYKKFLFHYCVYLTEHCNLNCQMCNTFSPIAEPAFYDVKEYEEDCKKLSKLFKNRTHKIFLMGGEPTLHKDLTEFMRISRKYFPSKKTVIEVLSNGVLILSLPEKFWEACKEYNIELAISKYPVGIDYEKIEKKAKEYNINVSYHKGFVNDIERKSYRYQMDETGQQDIKNAYRCYSASLAILKYGKVYKCPICASINNFNKYFGKNLERTSADYIDLNKKNKVNDIFSFLYHPSPFCKYCIIPEKHEPVVVDWDYSKKDISEWT